MHKWECCLVEVKCGLIGEVCYRGQTLRFQKLRPGWVSFFLSASFGFRYRVLSYLHAWQYVFHNVDNGLNLWTISQSQLNIFLCKSYNGHGIYYLNHNSYISWCIFMWIEACTFPVSKKTREGFIYHGTVVPGMVMNSNVDTRN